MIDVASFRDRAIAVMGLGRSGLAAAESLIASGADVSAWDDTTSQREAAAGRGVPLRDLQKVDWRPSDTLVLSPGIADTHPAPHPVAAAARDAGAAVICDIELLYRSQPKAAYVGVTGTNGKSTTTALIGHILKADGRNIEVGGNLGPPALAMRALGDGDCYVLELSSYQLERIPSVVFDVAILLNITPDHLDRHGGMDGYVAAKARIFNGQGRGQTAIVGVDDGASRSIYDKLRARRTNDVVPIAVGKPIAGGVYVLDGILTDTGGANPTEVADLRDLNGLPGAHNWQNAAAAYAACRAIGIAPNIIVDGLISFPGLPHRQELVVVVDGITFINDSKATNADAAEKALLCYDNIYWIAGGRAKSGGIADLKRHIDRIAHVFLIGECADDFAVQLDGGVAHTISGTLPAAVDDAYSAARSDGRPGAVVLLSPAAASFDQFANFEARGEAFRRSAEAIAARQGTAS
ncbi:MAG: UDP-N-acetylmuramoyl-L-alanine--D-glutamate ligase [Alphaproteobacteria bacterium]|nr:UDP-N-acetylmuramoyl-L-alanine--D-glutamate ligase [Alphaproteobacteria bacterium]